MTWNHDDLMLAAQLLEQQLPKNEPPEDPRRREVWRMKLADAIETIDEILINAGEMLPREERDRMSRLKGEVLNASLS